MIILICIIILVSAMFAVVSTLQKLGYLNWHATWMSLCILWYPYILNVKMLSTVKQCCRIWRSRHFAYTVCSLFLMSQWGCSSAVERSLCMWKVPGSIPGISTITFLHLTNDVMQYWFPYLYYMLTNNMLFCIY